MKSTIKGHLLSLFLWYINHCDPDFKSHNKRRKIKPQCMKLHIRALQCKPPVSTICRKSKVLNAMFTGSQWKNLEWLMRSFWKPPDLWSLPHSYLTTVFTCYVHHHEIKACHLRLHGLNLRDLSQYKWGVGMDLSYFPNSISITDGERHLKIFWLKVKSDPLDIE